MNLVTLHNYIETCEIKSLFHKTQSRNALNWYNMLGICSVIILSGQALSMTVQSAMDVDSLTVGITGASFAFILSIFNRIQMVYMFHSLSILHSIVADDYNELVEKLKLLEFHPNNELFEQYILRYVSITEKSHIQQVNECGYLMCCC